MSKTNMTHQAKPELSFWKIWNMCVGFAGIQVGFALQNANVSRIFQSLGADIKDIPMLWVAAPITGLLVQPIVGYMSDKTWNGLGRRRPYLVSGAVAASLALFVMPNASELWVAAGMLWLLNAALNVAHGPAIALIGDMLPRTQRSSGFAMQSFFISISAVLASALPWLLSNFFGVSNLASHGSLPSSVIWAFYISGALLLASVLWTSFTVREYVPSELHRLCEATSASRSDVGRHTRFRQSGWAMLAVGAVCALAIATLELDAQLYLIAGGIVLLGLLQIVANIMRMRGRVDNAILHLVRDTWKMPVTMRQLALVQFLSWFAFFSLWIYGTSAVTSYHFGSRSVTSPTYSEGADWVGVLFAAYNGFAALAALAIPYMTRKLGLKATHSVNLAAGFFGFLSFYWIEDARWLIAAMLPVGFAWASIISLPYAILSYSLPARKMGTYAGIFNLFIVIPQIVASGVMAFVVHHIFDGQTILVIVLAGFLLLLASAATLLVNDAETAKENGAAVA